MFTFLPAFTDPVHNFEIFFPCFTDFCNILFADRSVRPLFPKGYKFETQVNLIPFIPHQNNNVILINLNILHYHFGKIKHTHY